MKMAHFDYSFTKLMDIYIVSNFWLLRIRLGTSLVAQWLRIHLPMKGPVFDPWSGKIPHAAEQLSL